ncbi:Protein tweety-like 3 [Ophiophagus hannah]|uniref:Protein tweety homolog n=1 Tax=Ophiophagus hannah TaxID=8665 RepID=V8NKB3_OPHHA|nr:Protein tweety-like 3 [Ophiophagus hannah]
MQDDILELLKLAVKEYPTSKEHLIRIQDVLNSTEINLQHLTALVDCRSLHLDYVQALTGFCYDGVEGLIYLVLFSFVTALMFSSIVCSVPHTWQQKRNTEEDGEEESTAQGNRQTHDNLYRVHMPSLYSCGSSYGSETSIPAAAHTVSNAPVTEYMTQNANFQNPRCENTPLIGRESPPPSGKTTICSEDLDKELQGSFSPRVTNQSKRQAHPPNSPHLSMESYGGQADINSPAKTHQKTYIIVTTGRQGVVDHEQTSAEVSYPEKRQ